ncbi:MAG: hypothetical protein P9L99_13230 [Candidatus Lernaella stagnicola]|nr:hypothetical protein [Candidatus Lernaella stagnicola]
MKSLNAWLIVGLLLIATAALLVTACGDDDDDDGAGMTGTLTFTANGEEFIREGFVDKTGWLISFDHFYITLSGLTGIQVAEETDEQALTVAHAGHPHEDIPEGAAHVALDGVHTLDLTEGDGPQEVGSLAAPAGNYNYAAFNMVQSEGDFFPGYSIVMQGVATKDSDAIAFTIKLNEQMTFTSCHQEVNDEFAGVVDAGGNGTLETTFHSDHLFGDYEDLGNPEGVNPGALGFQAFADLAAAGALEIDQDEMAAQMDPDDYATFVAALFTLGHSGEGHCNYNEYEAQ